MSAPLVFVQGPVLGLESTGTLTGAALYLRGRLVAEISEDARASSAEKILDQTQKVLSWHGLNPRDLSRIGVDVGPGSFTGIRVGLAACKGLAAGAGIPVVPVPSHQALAWPWREMGRCIVLMTGLRRGQICLEAGRWHDDAWVADLPARSAPVVELPGLLRSLPEAGQLLFTGEAVESGCSLFPEVRDLGIVVQDSLSQMRRPAAIACLAARAGAPEHRGLAIEALEPLYLRGADARRPGGTAAPGKQERQEESER